MNNWLIYKPDHLQNDGYPLVTKSAPKNIYAKNLTHIVPKDDIYVHIVDDNNPNCSCNPTFNWDDLQVIHNSWDGREQYENGTKKPN